MLLNLSSPSLCGPGATGGLLLDDCTQRVTLVKPGTTFIGTNDLTDACDSRGS